MRIAFVVQRYGDEVAGGAEALCRGTARALAAAGHEMTVLTTTARDHLTWAPFYPAGEGRDGAVLVRRFANAAGDPAAASRHRRALAVARAGWEAERGFALAQGPVSPGLVAALAEERDRYEAIVLWTYLYATTQLAAPIAAGRSVLVPAAHDEPMLRFATTRGVVALADAFAFLTPEEWRLVDDLHGVGRRPAAVVGAGLDAVWGDAARARRAVGLPPRFALYLGRVDAGKGVAELIAAHEAYRARGGELGLVLAGRADEHLRVPRWATAPGFVTATTRSDLLAAAEVVVMPSRNESLSLALMEAWQEARPTLATGRSDVLAGQTARSGGGLLYLSPDDYVRQLSRLQVSEPLRAALGAAGAAWAARQTWPAAAERWTSLLEDMRARRAVSGAGSSGRPSAAS